MPPRISMLVAACLCVLLLPTALFSKKKKKQDEEPVTQTLPVLKDPPSTIVAETDRLSFHLSPLSGKGLLSAQVRDALKYLIRENHGSIVKLRAFVAGTGDMRRFPTIVSELFTEKKLNLPVLTTVQAGGLPLEGAQVVIESVSVDKKPATPQGIGLVQALPVSEVAAVLRRAGLSGNRVLRATCFAPSLEHYADDRAAVQQAFPNAVINIVQMQRIPVRSPMMCETVAALERAPDGPVQKLDSSRLALLAPGKIVFTGTQMAFRDQESDVKLAFDRLGKTMEGANTNFGKTVLATIYPLAEDIAARVHAVQFRYFAKESPPVISSIPMEGLPSMDASFAIEVVALP